MVKARKNRQPKPWDKMTQVRSVSNIHSAKAKSRGSKDLPLEGQLEVLEYEKNKLSRRIRNLRKRSSEPNADGKPKSVGEVLSLELTINKIHKRQAIVDGYLFAIKEKIVSRNLKEQKTKLTIGEHINRLSSQLKENAEQKAKEREETLKIRSSDQVPFLDSIRAFRPEKPLGKIRTYVVKDSKGKKTVKRKWMDNRDKK